MMELYISSHWWKMSFKKEQNQQYVDYCVFVCVVKAVISFPKTSVFSKQLVNTVIANISFVGCSL